MELNSLTTYKTGFQLVKIIVITVLIVSGAAVCFTIYVTETQKQELRKMIYVINSEGQVSQAHAAHQQSTRIYEYENHVRTFYRLWYQFDEGSYTRNIEMALPLAGETGRLLLDEYREQNLLRRLQERNLRLTVEIEKVEININSYPVTGYIEGIQTIQRENHRLLRKIRASFDIWDFDRSRENPHGAKIENWNATAESIE